MTRDSSFPNRTARVLLVDGDAVTERVVRRLFAEPGYACSVATTASQAIEQLSRIKPDVVLLANRLADGSGLDLLSHLDAVDRRLPVLFGIDEESGCSAIEAMKRGAFDLVVKPLDSSALVALVLRALQARRLLLGPVQLADDASAAGAMHLVGRSAAMREIHKSIGRAVRQDMSVLITGPEGTGKEHVARLIHEHGPRAHGPLVTVRCKDVEPLWLESELFGHEPGGISSTVARPGAIERCQGGVLLLREIDELRLSTQGRLVDWLRTGKLRRLGASESVRSDAILVATTSADLPAAVAAGRFQGELFYALRSFTISLPPLRQRREDIPLLVDHFIKVLSGFERAYGGEAARVSAEALVMLSQHDWPGNVDELKSVLKWALLEGKGSVLATEALQALVQPCTPLEFDSDFTKWSALVERATAGNGKQLYESALAEMERRLLPLVMRRCGGSQVKAAHVLGITRGSLRKKLRLHGLLAPVVERSAVI